VSALHDSTPLLKRGRSGSTPDVQFFLAAAPIWIGAGLQNLLGESLVRFDSDSRLFDKQATSTLVLNGQRS